MIESGVTKSLVEQRLDFTEPLLGHSDFDGQIAAIHDFVASIKSYVLDREKMRYILEVESLLDQANDAEYAKRLAISCFDFCISDEMRTYEASNSLPTDAAAVYYRSDVYKTQYPQRVKQVVENHTGHSLNEMILVPAKIIDDLDIVGSRGALTENIAYIVDEHHSPSTPHPPIGMPRQEIYRELLFCGINPLEVATDSVDLIDTNDNRAYRRLHRLRGSLALRASEADFQDQRSRVESHWRTILAESNEVGHVALFSSGVSSNEASMRAVAEASDRVYVHPYWYYENGVTVDTIFGSVEQDLDDATALLINLEPTNYFTFDEKPEPPITTMERFTYRAIENPNQQYSLVIDATVDPPFSLRDKLGKTTLPANLTIVKTVSATKHQDGGRNYFFGVAHVDDPGVYERIIKNQGVAGSMLYESHITHFPLPKLERIQRRRLVSSQLGSDLEELNTEKSGWKFESYSYHSFLMPPRLFVEQIAGMVGRCETQQQAEEYMKNINNEIYSIVSDIARDEEGSIEVGDSFAFPVTRVNTQGGPNSFGSYSLALKIPRIAMGYRDGSTDGIRFAEKLINRMNQTPA